MAKNNSDSEKALLKRWHKAERNAVGGDCIELVKLLRHFARYPGKQTHEFPNLNFVADMLDEKKKKKTKKGGRPSDSNLVRASKELRAGLAVDKLKRLKGLTVEQAVAQAAKEVLMSESGTKKHYYECRRLGLISNIRTELEVIKERLPRNKPWRGVAFVE